MPPQKRLSDLIRKENAEEITASLRKYGYGGSERPSDLKRWLEAQGEDINTPVAEAKQAKRELRPKQEAFRQALLQAYGGCCAISGCNVAPALEAAHVANWRSENDVGAGILLRADLHRLFDAGLLVISCGYRVVAAPPWYQELVGTRLRLPKNRLYWPRLAALDAGNFDAKKKLR